MALQINKTVTVLDLRDNAIDDKGFHDLLIGLMDNAHLRELDLSNNPGPGKTGIEKLSGILDPRKRKMPTLRVLKLSEVRPAQSGPLYFEKSGANHVKP